MKALDYCIFMSTKDCLLGTNSFFPCELLRIDPKLVQANGNYDKVEIFSKYNDDVCVGHYTSLRYVEHVIQV